MKMLRLAAGPVLILLILAMVLLYYAFFVQQSTATQGSNVIVEAITKDLSQAPQMVNNQVGADNADGADNVDSADRTDGADDMPKIMITGTTDIPLYPDAYKVEAYYDGYYDKPGGGKYSFMSDASLDSIVSFYKRELAKSGWTVETEGFSATSALLDFGWVNPVKEVPIRRHLHLSVRCGPPGTGCEIWLRFERWPDPEYVPLYPNAQQVQVAWEREAEFGFLRRVTTYEAKANVEEIEAYYKDAMAQHGWKIGRSEPNNLFFSYRHDLPCPPEGGEEMRWCGTGSLVEVNTYPQENGTTKVELRVGGNEILATYKGK